jgi:replicative DNA helicase
MAAVQPVARPEAVDSQLVALRVPPHSVEAEQSLLGALLLDNQAFDRVADVVTVGESIEASEDKDKAGGLAYLAQLAQNTPSALNIRRYAELVRERAVQRRLAHVATEIAESALAPSGKEVAQLLDEAESKIFQIAESGARKDTGLVGISPVLAKVFERIDHLHSQENPSDITGVPTGFTELDQRTAGLQPGDLIIVAGRPSMGKTAFALNIAEYVALHPSVRLPVAVFSMEMSANQLAMRVLSSMAKVDQSRLRTGRLNDEEWSRLTEEIARLNEAKIHVDETAALNALELRARARRMKREYGKLGLVVVDYLQLMSASSQGENRATEISEISRSLKAMAKELDVPVVALSQLNRALEQRPNKRPQMADLRESGAIEQDADVILAIYRDEVYNPETPDKGTAEVIILKQRNGPIGTVKLTFLGQFTRFENYAGPDSF